MNSTTPLNYRLIRETLEDCRAWAVEYARTKEEYFGHYIAPDFCGAYAQARQDLHEAEAFNERRWLEKRLRAMPDREDAPRAYLKWEDKLFDDLAD